MAPESRVADRSRRDRGDVDRVRGKAWLGIIGVAVATATLASACSSDDDANASDGESAPTVVEEATAFFRAVEAGDRETASSYVDPELLESDSVLFGRADTLEGQLLWYDAIEWEWTFAGCEPGSVPTHVECSASVSNPWADAVGESPIEGTHVVRPAPPGW